jgi:hypothetical protein
MRSGALALEKFRTGLIIPEYEAFYEGVLSAWGGRRGASGGSRQPPGGKWEAPGFDRVAAWLRDPPESNKGEDSGRPQGWQPFGELVSRAAAIFGSFPFLGRGLS